MEAPAGVPPTPPRGVEAMLAALDDADDSDMGRMFMSAARAAEKTRVEVQDTVESLFQVQQQLHLPLSLVSDGLQEYLATGVNPVERVTTHGR